MNKPTGTISAHWDVIYSRFPPNAFVGRDWLLEDIAHFRDNADKRHLIIVGEPGSGKSAFLAYLAERWNCPRHFIRVGSNDGVTGVDPRQFFISIGFQLRQKYGSTIFAQPEQGRTTVTVQLAEEKAQVVGRVIEELHTLPFIPVAQREVVVDVDTARGESEIVGERVKRVVNVAHALDTITLLHVAVLQPAWRLYKQDPDAKVVICVDALDESLQHRGEQIVDFIPAAEDPDLPSNLRFVMTSRRGSHLDRFRQQDRLYLDDKERGYWQEQVKDTETYIAHQLGMAPFLSVVDAWLKGKQQAYKDEIRDKSDGNFLYLYYFFKEMRAAVTAGTYEEGIFTVPAGLDAIYEQFALARIRKQVHDSIYFPVTDILPDELVEAWRRLEGVEEISVDGEGVTIVAPDSDRVLLKLLRTAWQSSVDIDEDKFVTCKGSGLGNWEEKYLPLLGVLAVAFEPLSREQLTAFAGVELAFVDSIIYHILQFLDVTSGTNRQYAFYHRSFAEYLLDHTRNHAYPLDGEAYHARISNHYRGDKETWSDVDWTGVEDDYPFHHLLNHLVAAHHLDEAQELLKQFDWMHTKLSATDANALLSDYNRMQEEHYDIELLFKVLSTSAHILLKDKTQLWYQLFGRAGQMKGSSTLLAMPSIPPESDLIPKISNLATPDQRLLRMYAGHHSTISVLAFLPDGLSIIGADDQSIFLLDISSGKQRLFAGRIYDVRTIAVSPDGKFVASGGGLALGRSFDNEIKLWYLETRENVQTLEGHDEPIGQLVYTPDGERIISASWDRTIRLWALKTGKTIQEIVGHTEGLNAVALIPGGAYIVSGASDSTVRVWDLETGSMVCALSGHEDFVLSVAAFSSGRRIVSGSSDTTVRIWDLDQRKEIRCMIGHAGAVFFVHVPDDQSRVVSASVDGTLRTWNAKTGEEQACIYNDLRFSAVAVSPDGKNAVTASGLVIKYWDIYKRRDGERRTHVGHTRPISGLQHIRDLQLVVSSSLDGTVKVWDFSSGKELRTLFLGEAILQIGLLSLEQSVLLLSRKGTKVWDVRTGILQTTNPDDLVSDSDDVLITENGYVVTTYTDVWTSLRVFNANTSQMYQKVFGAPRELDVFMLGEQGMEHKGRNDYYCIVEATPDGKYLLMYVNSDSGVFVLDISTGEKATIISDSTLLYNSIHGMTFTADHRYLIIQRGIELELWDVNSWSHVRTLQVADCASTIVTSNDSKRLLCGYRDGAIRIWNIETGRLDRTFERHSSPVHKLMVSDDDRFIYTLSKDANLRAWSMDDGRALGSIYFDTLVRHAAVSPGGVDVLVGEESGRIHLLHLIEH